MITPDQIAGMADDVAELRRLLLEYAATVPLIDVSGGSASGAAKGFISQLNTQVAQLDADRALVFTGLRSYSSWKNTAESFKATMRSSLGDAAEYSGYDYAKNAVSATAGEVGQDLVRVKDAATSGTTWGIAAALVVLFVAWKVAR